MTDYHRSRQAEVPLEADVAAPGPLSASGDSERDFLARSGLVALLPVGPGATGSVIRSSPNGDEPAPAALIVEECPRPQGIILAAPGLANGAIAPRLYRFPPLCT